MIENIKNLIKFDFGEEYKKNLSVLGLLSGIVWLAHFSHLRHFSVYEDDITFIVGPMQWSPLEFLASLKYLLYWPQGRPLYYLLSKDLAYMGNLVGGLVGIYFIAFMVIALNTYLFYKVCRQAGFQAIALLGAFAFAIYPADTTQQFLTHALGNQIAMTMLLLGLWFYLKHVKYWPYILILFTLLIYEPPFFVFLGAPLLTRNWDKKTIKELLANGIKLAAIMSIVLLVRMVIGEGRVGELLSGEGYLLDIPQRILLNSFIGPATGLSAFVRVPLEAWKGLDSDVLLHILLSLPLLYLIVNKAIRATLNANSNKQDPHIMGLVSGNRFPGEIRIMILGLIFLVLGYLGSFSYFPANDILGRATRVHIAGSLGGGIMFGAICSLALRLAKERSRIYSSLIVILVIYFSLLLGYRVTIQQDYVKAHEIQSEYWADLLNLTTDVQEGTIILVRVANMLNTDAIEAISWGDIFVMENIYHFPEEWELPPRVISVWLTDLKFQINHESDPPFFLYRGFAGLEFPIVDGNVILLEYENGELVRREGIFEYKGQFIELKSIEPYQEPEWEKNTLFDILVRDTSEGDD